MKKVEYSKIVRRKLKNLRAHLTSEFGAEVSYRCGFGRFNASRTAEKFLHSNA